MLQLHSGQCGLCSHFGEEHSKDSKLVEIRTSRKARRRLWMIVRIPGTPRCISR